MVLVPFAETKGTRRESAKARKINRLFKNTKPNLILPFPYYFETSPPPLPLEHSNAALIFLSCVNDTTVSTH